MPDNILDKVAIVTGGTGALGRHIVEKFAREGMKVYVPSMTLSEFNSVFDRSEEADKEDFTVVGIGDMSGDVFGNGMLMSKHIKLVAAYNHMHIFLDPNPNAEKSFATCSSSMPQPLSSTIKTSLF